MRKIEELRHLLDVAKMNYRQLGGVLDEDQKKQEEEKESARYRAMTMIAPNTEVRLRTMPSRWISEWSLARSPTLFQQQPNIKHWLIMEGVDGLLGQMNAFCCTKWRFRGSFHGSFAYVKT